MSELKSGAIVTWKSPKEVSFAQVRAALRMNSFDEEVAKDMAPRSAFARAAKKLDDDRIIRKVEEDDNEITFQFTKEYLAGGQLNYDKEFDLKLSKTHGKVTCENAEMGAEAQRLVDHHLANREASDVTRLIQKIFESEKGDLIPVRAQGGCYYVPESHRNLVQRVKDLLAAMGGELAIWEITIDSPATAQAVQGATFDYMLNEVDEFRKTIEEIDQDTKPAVLQRRLQKISMLKQKLSNYAPLLLGLHAEVQNAISHVEGTLNQKATGSFEESPEVTSAVEEISATELLSALAEEPVVFPPEGDIPLPDDLEFDGMPPMQGLMEMLSEVDPPMPELMDLDQAEQLLAALDMPSLPD